MPATPVATSPPESAAKARDAETPRGPDATSHREHPGAAGAASPRAAVTAEPPTGSLDVVSQPPGASVYLDDELIGTTDPEWGRLARSAVPAGRHRVRLALAGHGDVVEEVEVGAKRADGAPPPPDVVHRARRSTAGSCSSAVAVVLLGVTAWALRRPSAARPRGHHGARPPGRRFRAHAGAQHAAGFGQSRRASRRRRPRVLRRVPAARAARPRRHGLGLSRPSGGARSTRSSGRCPRSSKSRSSWSASCARRRSAARSTTRTSSASWSAARSAGVPFFTMELVPGETLQALLQRVRALEPRPATQVVVQVAEALDYAHLKGVVHRDLKPSNVMVLPDGTVKVMDYGIARARRFEGLTVTGRLPGQPRIRGPGGHRGPRHRRAQRPLLARRHLLRDAHRPPALRRRHALRDPPQAPHRGPAAAVAAPSRRARGAGAHRAAPARARRRSERYAAAEDLVLDLRDFLNRAA